MSEERELQERSRNRRLFELDSLRGLAALSVVAFHCRLAYSVSPPGTLITLISAGRQAVVLFFLMSGYVLSLPYWKARKPAYGTYLLRRFFRIYVPFAAALFAAAGFAAWFRGSQLRLSPFFAETWQVPVTASLLLHQLLMWPTAELNVSFWSLRYEVQMSVVMPVLCMVLRRVHPGLFMAGMAILVFGRPYLLHRMSWHYSDMTLQVAFLFAGGALLARYAGELEVFWRRLAGWRLPVFLFSLFFYYNFPARLLPGKFGAELAERADLITAIGSAGIILSALNTRLLSRCLRHPLPEYLGRISYSLYMVHGIVVFALMDSLYPRVPRVAMIPLIFAVSILVAHLFCILVEEPSLRLGKRLASAVRG